MHESYPKGKQRMWCGNKKAFPLCMRKTWNESNRKGKIKPNLIMVSDWCFANWLTINPSDNPDIHKSSILNAWIRLKPCKFLILIYKYNNHIHLKCNQLLWKEWMTMKFHIIENQPTLTFLWFSTIYSVLWISLVSDDWWIY